MTIKVIGSLTSPFVRTVRAACAELSVEYDLLETTFYKKMSDADQAIIDSNNPLMKVPVLLDGEQVVLDSRVIIEYLRDKFETSPVFKSGYANKAEEQNVITTIYGMVDAGVLRFILSSEDVDMNTGYLKRSLERMKNGLEYLDAHPDLGKDFGVAEMLLICALDWFTKRDVVDWSGYANICAAHEQWKDRPSLVLTRIPETA